jgi:hypothetical protein
MPRTNDPLGILTGAGFAPPGSVSSSSISPGEVGPVSETLDAHVENPTGAHPASAISILDPYTRYFMGPNVEGALNELAALVPPPMGGVGSEGVAWLGSTNVGTPDWGILKLWDGILPFTGNTAANARAVYPYYYRAPVTASGYGLTGTGVEPATDPTFNVFDPGVPAYTGGGNGAVHAGFVTLTVGYPTWRILSAIAAPAAVVSGIVSPSDRGVLALVKWPSTAEPDPAPAGNVSDIQNRCVAALLLGKGILDNGCDGEPGGVFEESSGSTRAFGDFKNVADPGAPYDLTIDLSGIGGPAVPVVFSAVVGAPATPYEFTDPGGAPATAMQNFALAVNTLFYPGLIYVEPSGTNANVYVRVAGSVGNTVTLTSSVGGITATGCGGGVDAVSSPYNFPGRAAGQYHLDEIHTGSSVTLGADPFFNPAAGQVRLLTDPAAVTFSPATVAGGLPIFGATNSAIGTSTSVPGLPFNVGGGTAGNFFAYRLPYLKDYSVASGLIYTPVAEKTRFTTKLAPASAGALTQAGDYDDFTTDFWAYQIARYRHRFDLALGAAATRADGNYALVHFKKEAYFEAYVRDGIVPASDQLWSVNLVQWTGNVAPYDLLENLVTSVPGASAANPVNRSEIFEDNNGAAPIAPAASSFTITETGALTTMFSSGIEYYVPIEVTTVNDPNIDITALSFTYNGVFNRGYRSHDTVPVAGPLSGDNRAYALNQNLLFVSLASFSFEGTETVPPTSTIITGSPGVTTFPAGLGEIRRQRVEFGYADLTPAATVDPAVGDTASYNFVAPGFGKGINFTGDPNYPVFTTDAKVRLFLRRPLVVDGVTGYSQPSAGATVPNSSGNTVLYHSMQEGTATIKVPYGNPSNPVLRGVSNAKDTEELFLDEIYRYPEDWTPLGPPDATQLQGPGLTFGPAPISVPVRPDAAIGYDGWYLQNLHLSQLDNVTANLSNALQVAGFPPRDPSYQEGLTSPFPSRGVLIYPQTDFSASHSPTQAAGAASDYSVLTGDRVYIRAFDAGAANAGLATVKFRLWGVDLTDFQYTPLTGPGATGMAVLVKVPGLTTWLDAGRSDGAGPSKQDIALDGAGCLLASTVATDTVSQIRYTDITLNLAPAALFINGEGKCPVLVKVILKDNATGKALNFANVAETAATSSCRGLVGIDIL